jgi:hypothetical protein
VPARLQQYRHTPPRFRPLTRTVFVQPLPGAVDSAVLSQRQPALIVTVTTALRYLDREKEGLRRDLRQLYEEPPAGLLMCDSLLMGGAQRSAPDSAVLHSADVAHKGCCPQGQTSPKCVLVCSGQAPRWIWRQPTRILPPSVRR